MSGSQTFGSAPPAFTAVSALPPGVGLTGTPTCTKVSSGATIDASLSAGPYTLDARSCSGLSLTAANPANYSLNLVGGSFIVNPEQLQVTVSGNEGSNPEFKAAPVSFPSGVTLTVPPNFTCTRIIATINNDGSPGTPLTVDASSCTKLSLSSNVNGFNPGNYALNLVNGPFRLGRATTSPTPSPSN